MKTRIRLSLLAFASLVACGRDSTQLEKAASAAATGKVAVCHVSPGLTSRLDTISITAQALPAHLAHGDLEGACESIPASPVVPVEASLLRPDACCSDPTCDRIAFAQKGGICAGDPRLKGPLPYRAPVKQGS